MPESAKTQDVILVIRLGAMGDIIHALPAVASLKQSFPEKRLVWLVARKWIPLLIGNPYVDELIPFERQPLANVPGLWRGLRAFKPQLAVDFQGLVQSAVAGRAARPEVLIGFDRTVAREPFASRLYMKCIPVSGPHRVQRNLQLIEGAGAKKITEEAWIPAGAPEGRLPSQDFVLASPFAGWNSKQWPVQLYEELGQRLRSNGFNLVLNVSQSKADELSSLKHVHVHSSSLPGLIDATRKASAVVGVDSGPLHLAAALNKPGVAMFGPTDPAQTGPYGGSMTVLRKADAATTYKRGQNIHPSMLSISVDEVCRALLRSLPQTSIHVAGATRSS